MSLKLANRIVLVVSVLALGATLGMGITAIQLSSNALIKQSEEMLLLSAQEGVELLEASIAKDLRVLEEIAARARTVTMDWQIQRESLLPDVERLGYIDIGIMLPDGHARHVFSEDAQLGDRLHNQRALKGEANVSDVLISRVTNQAVVLYAVPIYVDGQVAAVLFARKDAAAFGEVVDRISFGDNGYAYVVGKDGTLFAHPDRERVMEQHNILTDGGEYAGVGPAFNALGLGNAGVINYVMGDSKRYMGVAPMRSTEWSLAVGAFESDILAGVKSLQIALFVGAGVFLVIGAVAALFIGRGISKPVVALSAVIDRFARFDLTNDEDNGLKRYSNRKDEIADIINSLATMQQNLVTLIKQIAEQAQQLAASSQELTATSQQSAASADEVARAIEEIAYGASGQALDTEKGVSSVVEMGEQIVANQQDLQRVNEANGRIAFLKDEGLDIIKELVEKTEASGHAAQVINDNIHHTNENAQKIEAASQMINNIAAQTNLLALNAAIEAARAGEAGRGFAVVADEIRKLAEESNNFTEEISEVVRELTAQAAAAVDTMAEVGLIVQAQVQSVDLTNEKFDGIAAGIEEMQRFMAAFNLSMEEMGLKKDDILGVIQGLSAIAEENAAGTEEVSASVEEQTAAMADIARASISLAELAQAMQESIVRFKY